MPILRGVLWTDTLDDRSHGLTSVLAVWLAKSKTVTGRAACCAAEPAFSFSYFQVPKAKSTFPTRAATRGSPDYEQFRFRCG